MHTHRIYLENKCACLHVAALPLALLKTLCWLTTTGLFLFPTSGHYCAAKQRRQHSWHMFIVIIYWLRWRSSSHAACVTYLINLENKCACMQCTYLHYIHTCIFPLMVNAPRSGAYIVDPTTSKPLAFSSFLLNHHCWLLREDYMLTIALFLFPTLVTAPRSGANIADLLVYITIPNM